VVLSILSPGNFGKKIIAIPQYTTDAVVDVVCLILSGSEVRLCGGGLLTDVSPRSRFPLQSLLPGFLCTLCGYGSQGSTGSLTLINETPHEDIGMCTRRVFFYMRSMPSFCMVLHPDNELVKENLIVRRPGGGSGGSLYTNLRALDFAGTVAFSGCF
jgi:hypothetical protein